MTSDAFDFRKPPPGELERQMGKWLALMARQSAAIWSRLIPYPSELKAGPVVSVTATQGLNALTDDTLGFPFTTADAADGSILLAMQRPLLLSILAGLLGETPSALPADRNLTDLESSLLGYLIRELFLTPLEKGWPGADAPVFAAGNPGTPRAVWRVPGGDTILLGTMVLSAPFGEHPFQLLAPRTGRWERMSAGDPRGKPVPPAPKEQIEAIVRDMRVDLAVVLGTAELTMHDLAQLKSGDLVLLRQKVTQPLDGFVSGTRKYRVWPGVVGTHAAVVIDSPAED